MNTRTLGGSQQVAAKVVGWCYVLAMPLALFAEFYVTNRLIVRDDPVATARNIVAHERLFRLGIASNIAVFAIDVALLVALYVVLAPVSRHLALLAAAWRVVETALLVGVVAINDFTVLRILSRPAYVRVFGDEYLQATARISIGGHAAGYNVGLIFAGLGSTVFSWLWYKSAYVPKPIAVWGVFSSLSLATCTFTFIVFPDLSRYATIAVYGGPIFVFELAMGLWLIVARLRLPGTEVT